MVPVFTRMAPSTRDTGITIRETEMVGTSTLTEILTKGTSARIIEKEKVNRPSPIILTMMGPSGMIRGLAQELKHTLMGLDTQEISSMIRDMVREP